MEHLPGIPTKGLLCLTSNIRNKHRGIFNVLVSDEVKSFMRIVTRFFRMGSLAMDGCGRIEVSGETGPAFNKKNDFKFGSMLSSLNGMLRL